jgi:hypothetical protein
MKNKYGVDYYYIVAKILLELKTLTPKEVDLLFEKLKDFALLSEDGEKIEQLIRLHVWDSDDVWQIESEE